LQQFIDTFSADIKIEAEKRDIPQKRKSKKGDEIQILQQFSMCFQK
jgi:hypothetical protein